MSFQIHVNTERLNEIAAALRTYKGQIETKLDEIEAKVKCLESEYAYSSPQSEEFKAYFTEFKNGTKAAFGTNVEEFAIFIENVSEEHRVLAQTISNNLANLVPTGTTVISKFN